MTVGSLFSGIGGLELGFEWAGFEVRWQVEQNPYALAVLEKHWPHVPRFHDVRDVGIANLEPVDVICGGFPCQDVSDAGLRAGIDGKRSGLWSEYARIVRELRPRFVAIENVRGLLVRGIDRVLGDLADLRYDAEWTRVRAADVGAPHRRERIFIVAYASDDGREQRGPAHDGDRRHAPGDEPDGRGTPVADAGSAGHTQRGMYRGVSGASQCGDQGKTSDMGGARGSMADATELLGTGRTGQADIDAARSLGPFGRWPARPGEAQQGWEPARVLRRAESGMGVVPDGLSPGLVRHRRRALEALGNAVVPQCAYLVALRVLELASSRGEEPKA